MLFIVRPISMRFIKISLILNGVDSGVSILGIGNIRIDGG
jgi:uncharacterized membrane protein